MYWTTKMFKKAECSSWGNKMNGYEHCAMCDEPVKDMCWFISDQGKKTAWSYLYSKESYYFNVIAKNEAICPLVIL